mmetsp:Transcript_94932/g.273265  ORF Transcript_94932/g.273265 Transcript_94932/m.273265 type:complete len:278 (+) Transcript_94932:423-1256(+)
MQAAVKVAPNANDGGDSPAARWAAPCAEAGCSSPGGGAACTSPGRRGNDGKSDSSGDGESGSLMHSSSRITLMTFSASSISQNFCSTWSKATGGGDCCIGGGGPFKGMPPKTDANEVKIPPPAREASGSSLSSSESVSLAASTASMLKRYAAMDGVVCTLSIQSFTLPAGEDSGHEGLFAVVGASDHGLLGVQTEFVSDQWCPPLGCFDCGMATFVSLLPHHGWDWEFVSFEGAGAAAAGNDAEPHVHCAAQPVPPGAHRERAGGEKSQQMSHPGSA